MWYIPLQFIQPIPTAVYFSSLFSYKQCFDKMLLAEPVIASMLLNPTVNSQASFYLTYRDFWHGYSFSHCNSFFTSFPEPHALLVFLRAPRLSLILLLAPSHLSSSHCWMPQDLVSLLCLLYSLAHLIQSYGFKYPELHTHVSNNYLVNMYTLQTSQT